MTYEYVCTECGHEWEAEQRISEAPLRDCPSCAKPNARRQISAGAGFILKGGGWYSDGYASAKSDGGSKSETKTDSSSNKTESKSDTSTKSDAGSKSETKKSDSGKAAAA